jgi:DNA-binding response OmpR family regulator
MKRILVVDDDPDTLEAVRILLELNGYEVLTSSKGDDAVNNVVDFSPNIIMLDVYLKGSNGVEICNRLKSSSLTRHIPIIMFSAESNDYLILRKCAADDFIAKPFDLKVLLAKVEQLLTQAKTGTEEVRA